MERLTRLLFVLSRAGSAGVAADRLAAVAAYGAADPADRRDQLRRDLRHLAALGWEISRTTAEGEEARYRLTAVDNRLRLEFTDRQRFELVRAARVAGLGRLDHGYDGGPGQDLDGDHDHDHDHGRGPGHDDDRGSDRSPGDDPDHSGAQGSGHDSEPVASPPTDVGPLDVVQRAVHRHCLLSFEYKGRDRVVHPYGLYSRTAGWYLTAREEGGDVVKTFAVARMTGAAIDAPGTATRPASPARPRLDPVSWLVDEPIDAVVATTAEHRRRVVDLLGDPLDGPRPGAPGDGERASGHRVEPAREGELLLTIRVTNRAAFRARLYELGVRVRLLGPPELREDVRAELAAVASGQVP